MNTRTQGQTSKSKRDQASERDKPARSKQARRKTPEERHRLIAESAYNRAARRDFRGGDPLRDWLAAEAEVDAMLVQDDDAGHSRSGAEQ